MALGPTKKRTVLLKLSIVLENVENMYSQLMICLAKWQIGKKSKTFSIFLNKKEMCERTRAPT